MTWAVGKLTVPQRTFLKVLVEQWEESPSDAQLAAVAGVQPHRVESYWNRLIALELIRWDGVLLDLEPKMREAWVLGPSRGE